MIILQSIESRIEQPLTEDEFEIRINTGTRKGFGIENNYLEKN